MCEGAPVEVWGPNSKKWACSPLDSKAQQMWCYFCFIGVLVDVLHEFGQGPQGLSSSGASICHSMVF